MAGEPSLVSGIAGIVPSGPAPEFGNDALRIFEAVKNIRLQQQQQAQQQLQTMLTLGEKTGMFPDQKTFEKTAKQAGIPIDGITAVASGQGGTPQQVTQLGKTLNPQAGAQSATPPSSNAAEKAPGGGVTNAMPSGSGAVEQGVAAANKPQSAYDQMVASAKQRLADQAMSAHQTAVMDQHVNDLKERVLQGDNVALGRLMAIGGTNLTPDQYKLLAASDEQKQAMIDIAAGQESPAQKELRLSNQASQLFGTGRYKDLATARAAAEGKQVETLPDLGRMVDEVKFTNELLQAGLSFDQAKDVGIKMANGVALADALPRGVVPIVQQQLQMQSRQVAAQEKQAESGAISAKADLARVGLEQERVRLEELRDAKAAQLDAQKLLLQLQEQNDKNFNSRFDNFVNMTRAGIKPDATFQENMVNELASRSGMTSEKVSKVWQWLTWSGPYAFKPKVTPEDTSVVKEGAGAPQTQKPPSSGVKPFDPSQILNNVIGPILPGLGVR